MDASTRGIAKRQRLAQRRKGLGLTQEALAAMLDVERSTVVRWERGETEPLPWIRPRLAKALGVSAGRLEELLDGGSTPGSGGAGPTVPRQLPAAVADFTGRAAELEALTRMLADAGAGAPGTVVVSAIGGTAGVGKTALAVNWAHQAADGYPDGQLYVNLRGYDPAQPVPAADALAGFLRALGMPSKDIPPEEDERAAHYRSLLAGRRMLIVLDNAGSEEQVRPLLPGTSRCAVLVTSRSSLAGMVARDGAARVELDVLPLRDAVDLLRSLIGARVDSEPGATATLAAQCCRLPLALRVAAELAIARPDSTIAGLVAELVGPRRLDLLDAGGDPHSALRAVFSWSYRHLDALAARAFRLAGLHPGSDLDHYAVAALVGTTVQQASSALQTLARTHLVQPSAAGRYQMHDLLRSYARDLAASDGEDERQEALTHLLDYYLHTAGVAMGALFPAEIARRPRLSSATTVTVPVTDPAAARTWLDSELPSLLAVAVYAAANGWPGHAIDLAATLHRYLDKGGHYPEAAIIHGCALRAARRSADRASEATALTNLGTVEGRRGRNQQAADHMRQALALFLDMGNLVGQARNQQNLGVLHFNQGSYEQSGAHLQQALILQRQGGDRIGEARILGNLGFLAQRQGRFEEATEYHQQSLTLFREVGERTGEAHALTNLGALSCRQGRYDEAARLLTQSLDLARQTGDRSQQALALADLGLNDLRQGQCEQASGHLRQALDLSREIGERVSEAFALNGLGEVFLATGQHDQARSTYAEALEVAGQTRDRHEQARAHDGLSRALHAAGDAYQARRHQQEARTLHTTLGGADQVHATS